MFLFYTFCLEGWERRQEAQSRSRLGSKSEHSPQVHDFRGYQNMSVMMTHRHAPRVVGRSSLCLKFCSLWIFYFDFLKNRALALAGVAQWIECWPALKGPLVQFPVRAHAWVAGWVPSRGCAGSNHTFMFLSPSLPLSLKIDK